MKIKRNLKEKRENIQIFYRKNVKKIILRLLKMTII
jgi:hypothetical protein